jgi:hypothetical protein
MSFELIAVSNIIIPRFYIYLATPVPDRTFFKISRISNQCFDPELRTSIGFEMYFRRS